MDLEKIRKALEEKARTAFVVIQSEIRICQSRGGSVTIEDGLVIATTEAGEKTIIYPDEIAKITGSWGTVTIDLGRNETINDWGGPLPPGHEEAKRRPDKLSPYDISEAIRAFAESPSDATVRFCQICLGSNVPGQPDLPKNGWCCGTWCDGFSMPLGICTSFRLDRGKLEKRRTPAT